MSDPIRNFGIQSWCLRTTKANRDVARTVRDLGLDSIELCGVHADFGAPDTWKAAIDAYAEAGVRILSIGVQTFSGAPGERRWFEFLHAAGVKHVSAHFRVDSFHTAVPATVALAEEFDVRIALHTHGGYMFGGSPDVCEHLLKLGGPRLGLCIDTAWVMQIGPPRGNPVKWAEQFAGRVYGVHFKDFVFDDNAQWNDVVVGTGNLDIVAFADRLRAGGFDGYTVIEYEAEPENPLPALRRCVEEMRAKLGPA